MKQKRVPRYYLLSLLLVATTSLAAFAGAAGEAVPDGVAVRLLFRALAARVRAPGGVAAAHVLLQRADLTPNETATVLAAARRYADMAERLEREMASVSQGRMSDEARHARLAALRRARSQLAAGAVEELPQRLGPRLHEKLQRFCRDHFKARIAGSTK